MREAAIPSTYFALSRPSLDPSRYASTRRKPEAAAVATSKKAAQPDPEPRPGFATDELMPVALESYSPEPLVLVNVGAVLNRDGEPIMTAESDIRPPRRPTLKLEIVAPPAPKPKIELASLDLPRAKPTPKSKVAVEKPKVAAKKALASPYFVQLASGSNADRMGGEYNRIKAKKPGLFAGRSAQVTNGKALFRLVIGPFKSRDDSGVFVNQLAKAGIDGFTYTAPDGMTFEKIATK